MQFRRIYCSFAKSLSLGIVLMITQILLNSNIKLWYYDKTSFVFSRPGKK